MAWDLDLSVSNKMFLSNFAFIVLESLIDDVTVLSLFRIFKPEKNV